MPCLSTTRVTLYSLPGIAAGTGIRFSGTGVSAIIILLDIGEVLTGQVITQDFMPDYITPGVLDTGAIIIIITTVMTAAIITTAHVARWAAQ